MKGGKAREGGDGRGWVEIKEGVAAAYKRGVRFG